MDYTTSVGYGLSQHRAADLARDAERRRSMARRAESATQGHTSSGARRRSRVPLRSPRFVLPVVGIALMGGLLGFAALPSDGPVVPAQPATVVSDPGSGGVIAAGLHFKVR
ncbi:hypothetical protein [Microbacterium thalassium]|uniref:Uncharacterized protein n=1 Tax=Microbacterium thalassium TaxID=362649 RepID=A0A7X0FQE9_9MICO|nr:hypothetical protein [Microbacterium thalassium]MBB6391783.1 hypothetical protein [Microbacterium thalassium]GLK24385.1 hypothetical protein GCM10017607_17030 [Microbacterium thalassium]